MTPRALRRWSAVALLALAPGAWTPAANAADCPAYRFTTSELPRLAEGIRVAAPGPYTVTVWAPADQVWALRAEGQTLTLAATPRAEGHDPKPSWRAVGQATLAADEPVKLLASGLPARPPKVTGKYQSGEQTIERPDAPVAVPALIALAADPSYDPAPAFDLIRGRADRVAPPADPRRTHVRTNHEGIRFHAPDSLDAWRARARAVREHLLVTLGLWPMPPRTPLNPQVFGKVERDGYTIEKVILETLPGLFLAGNLHRPSGHAVRRAYDLAGAAAPVRIDPGRVEADRLARWLDSGAW